MSFSFFTDGKIFFILRVSQKYIMTPKKSEDLTNTTDYWERYPVGKYSGNKRLDPSEMKERRLDNAYSRDLWLGEMIKDFDFNKHVENKINTFKQSIGLTTDPEKLDITIATQSHIDMAWKWRYEQTRRKGAITFQKAIFHAKKFPDNFNYCASEPILFDWFLQDDPEGFEELKEIVEEGGIELVGGSYVEPDCMMPSGESLVRSRLLGMKFYKEHFGILPKLEWFLDSFGYNYGLPQILKKSGAEYFWTSKITWNRQTIFPFVNFWWESPDGTRLLTSNFKQGWSVLESWMQFEIGRHPFKEDGIKEWDYASKDYENVDEDVKMDEIVPVVGVFAGKGDGGHGPTHEEVAFDQVAVKKDFAHWGKAVDVFKKLESYGDELPVWQDELYLEYHRGTFSVHWEVKRHNRLYENLLIGFENLSSLTSVFHGDYAIPLKQLDSVWKVVLLNQFHDVLPGSSIPEVYDDVYAMWMECNEIIGDMMEKWRCNLPVPENTEIVLSNSLSWKRKSPVFISVDQITEDVELDASNKPPYMKLVRVDDENEVLIGQPVSPEKSAVKDKADAKGAGWWTIVELDSFASKSYRVEILNGEEQNSVHKDSVFSASEDFISNGLVDINLDAETGAILKLKAESINEGNNILKGEKSNLTYGYLDDFPHDHAWNIKPEYWKYPLDIDNSRDVKITVEEKGPVFATLKIERTLGDGEIKEQLEVNSRIGANDVIQKITLFKDCPEVFLSYESDWQQPWVMLKVAYNTTTEAEYDVSDQAYCAIKRSTRPETRPDKARYEKIMHNYVDLSTPDKKWGIAMLNEGKYAYDASESEMRLTMLRTPRYPDPSGEAWVHKERSRRLEDEAGEPPQFVDLGFLRCRYALLPHKGGSLEDPEGDANAIVKNKAEEFNNPVFVTKISDEERVISDKSNKFLSNGTGLIKVDKPNVQISAVKQKQWEKSKNMILRVVENCGVDSHNTLITFCDDLAGRIKSITNVDLLERPLEEKHFSWNSDKGQLKISIEKFEILSFEVEFYY